MIDPIKEFLQINIGHNSASRLNISLGTYSGFLCTSPRSEPKSVFAEGLVQYWLQNLQQCLLDLSIRQRRDAKFALIPTRLWDRHLSHRTGPVRYLQNYSKIFGYTVCW